MRVKQLVMAVVLTGMLLNTGCMSYLNHERVKNNVIESRIRASGNDEQIDMLNSGIRPSRVVEVSAVGNDGVKVMVDVLDLKGLKALGTTFKEAPVSSTGALIVDIAATYFAVDAMSGSGGGNSQVNSVPNSANAPSTGLGSTGDIGDNNTFINNTFSGNGSDFSGNNVGTGGNAGE